MICRIARGHPLSLRLAAEADLAHLPIDEVGPRVVATLATAFRAGLDDEGRRLLDAASVPRRVTRGVLEAMACADDAMERLGALSFVDQTSEGLRLHDAVQAAVSARLRALEPERFRDLRLSAWPSATPASARKAREASSVNPTSGRIWSPPTRPLSVDHSSIGESRPAMTKRSSADSDGTSSCRSQGSAMRNTS
jgi:hypothetical protein